MATIADQPDIEVVGEVQNESDLADTVEQVEPDVLIVAMDQPEKRLGQCGFLLGRHPGMRILALAPEQNRGIFYWAVVDIRTKALESSEAGILNAVLERPILVGTAQNCRIEELKHEMLLTLYGRYTDGRTISGHSFETT